MAPPVASSSYAEGILSFADLACGGSVSFCNPHDDGSDLYGEAAEPVALHPSVTEAFQAFETLPRQEKESKKVPQALCELTFLTSQ